jgi:hypothetical protein
VPSKVDEPNELAVADIIFSKYLERWWLAEPPFEAGSYFSNRAHLHITSDYLRRGTDRAAGMRMVHMAEGVGNHFAEVM